MDTKDEVKILEKYKMMVFNELVKSIWLDQTEEIEKIPERILNDVEINDKKIDKETVKSLVRIVMGLDTSDDFNEDYEDIIKKARGIKEINQPIVSMIKSACKYCDDYKDNCYARKKNIDCNENDICSACGECMEKCKLGAISDKVEFIPMIDFLKDNSSNVYAIVAPAFVGQFGDDVTPGKLRSALKSMGFKDMIEVALAADMLTAKEAYEYEYHMEKRKDEYFITSCCCPIWVSLIQHSFPNALENVSPSVSPMIACGRAIKFLDENAKIVFIGPCIAKKKEATLDDINDAIDFVLTFKELESIFDALSIEPQNMQDDYRSEASMAGRVYARTGGVSKAIERSVKRLNKDVKFISQSFDGAKACKEGMQKVIDKEIDATFIEGMGCKGGCVGGPKRIIDIDKGTKNVDEYSENTDMETPFDNINVSQFLTSLGIKKIESLKEHEEKKIKEIFSRNLKQNK